MTRPSADRAALSALLVTVLVWGYSWVIMKQAMAYMAPLAFAAGRYLIGAAVLFPVLALIRQPLRPPPLASTLAIGLTQTAAFQGLEQWALLRAGAGRVAVLAYTMPFWVVLFAWGLLAERPSRRQWLGLALAGLGLVGVISPWRGLGDLGSVLLAIAGGAAWGLGTVLSKRVFRDHAPPALTLTAWQMLFGALALTLAAWAVPAPPPRWTPALLADLAYAGILASSLAWALWLYLVRRLPAGVVGLSGLAVPAVSVLLAWLVLGERPGAVEILGIALIGIGLAVVLWAPSPARRPASRPQKTAG